MKYPLGIQSFPELRKGGYTYVDKTALIYDLVQSGKYFFLSRPRRFGKSLLLSTLTSYFQGHKCLFDDLAISMLEKEWNEYPVIHIDLNIGEYTSADGLRQRLGVLLNGYEEIYGKNPVEESVGDRFEGIIKRAYKQSGRNVVVLIDEYDKPLLCAIGNERLQAELRDVLRSFYSTIKSTDQYIRFALLTGVTKFGHMSVFSGLNNPTDISFNPKYATICGITETEMTAYFAEGISDMSKYYDCREDEMIGRLRHMYDGYRFTRDDTLVYNPYSLLRAFYDGYMESYWFETGTPKYLVDLLQNHHIEISALEGATANQSQLSSIDTEEANPVPIIYQSGYLTIKDFDRKDNTYTLGFPNIEVREGFMQYLLPFYLNKESKTAHFDIIRFRKEVDNGLADDFMLRIKSLTADISYEILANCENDFQNMMYILFMMVSDKPDIERHTSDGRIDMVVETERYVYVMEFKIDSTAKEALDQINSKEYLLPWACSSKRVVKIGANFSTCQRRLTDFVVE